MPLNKGDKVIIVLFVIILIVSAVGIALYKPPKKIEIEEKEETGGHLYNVDWMVKEGSTKDVSEYISNKQIYEDEITIAQSNLKTVSFNLSWIDNRAFLGILGRDTFTLEVTSPDGRVYTESMQTARKTKTGNILINIPVNSNPPSITFIKANNTAEAHKILRDKTDDKMGDKEYTIKVSVVVGEKILWRLRDRGNSFTLSTSYEYYEPILKEKSSVNNTSHTTSLYNNEGFSTIGRMVTTGSFIRY
ncbi:MAG: hypothetical protein QXS02_03810 [Candidatus Thermoplasmatota archaeon]